MRQPKSRIDCEIPQTVCAECTFHWYYTPGRGVPGTSKDFCLATIVEIDPVHGDVAHRQCHTVNDGKCSDFKPRRKKRKRFVWRDE